MRVCKETVLVVALACMHGVDGLLKPKPSHRAMPAHNKNKHVGSRVRIWQTNEGVIEQEIAENPSATPSLLSKTKNLFSKSERQKLIQASTSGLAVSLAMVPEAVAFAFVAGVNPLVGLWTTVVLGFVAAALGGRAGICSSASGACSVVIAALCASHGPSYLSACAMMAGALQIGAGVSGMGNFIKLVPQPVMLGFLNGLAIVMTKAQMMHFKTGGKFMAMASPLGASTYGIAALTMVLVKLLPKLTKAIPPSLGAVVIATAAAQFMNLPAKTLADVAGASTFAGGWAVLPKIGLPAVPLSMETLQIVFPYALTMAAVGCLESLLTMQLIDGIVDDGKKGSTKKECVGQGSGNILSGLTGGIGGCALLGQSIINVQSGGGVSRWSGMSMATFLGFGIVAAAPLLASVPVASLVGVMLLVCQSTFSWSSLRMFHKMPRLDAFVIALVSVITVQKDLAAAVLTGTIASALGFAWKQSAALRASVSSNNSKSKTYSVEGPLFFGSTQNFESLFSVKNDPERIVIDFSHSKIMDHSAVDCIENLASKYKDAGKEVCVQGLSDESMQVLMNMYGERSTMPFTMIGDQSLINGASTTSKLSP